MPPHRLNQGSPTLEQQFLAAADRGAPLVIGPEGVTASFYVRDKDVWPYVVAVVDAAGNGIAGAEGTSSEVVVSGLPDALRLAVRSALGGVVCTNEGAP